MSGDEDSEEYSSQRYIGDFGIFYHECKKSDNEPLVRSCMDYEP